jgi:nitrite reductase (NO-forming)
LKKLSLLAALMLAATAHAAIVPINLTAKEKDLPIDNKGTMYRAWTFEGQVPGPVVRVTEGDTVEFTLTNDRRTSCRTRSTSTPRKWTWSRTSRPSSPERP